MNFLEPEWDGEFDAAGAKLRAARLGAAAGAEDLVANLYELEPGAFVSPLHFHHANEELLLVLAGEPTLRRGEGEERTLVPGEVVAFPTGPNGVHQVLNRSEAPARVLIVSTAILPEVAERVEEDAFAIITAAAGFQLAPRGEPPRQTGA